MRCTFCGNNIRPGTGKLYVKKSGRVLQFCSSKCENNALKLGRKPRSTKWTKTARKAKKVGK
jgi:large subunit ribosomal protein L24e